MQWYKFKTFLEYSTGFTMDAIHVLVGVCLLLFFAAILRRGVRHPLPWLLVLAMELANEWNDLHVETWPDRPRQLGEGFKDILLTMALPTLLLLVARYWPSLLVGSNAPEFAIREADLADPQIRALLALHLQGMHQNSPPDAVFALDLAGLRTPDLTVWAAWQGKSLAGIAALKALGDDGAEIKSMRTHPDHLRQGVAAALLEHIIAEARKRGYASLSLETGSGPAFEPALALYRKRGFAEGEPFADYQRSAFNQFLHLPLTPAVA